ncbi:S-formylglutathione hydrolase FrmB [Pedobacter psychrotolerans]|uniref:Esterase n=1 Tax=Pedobacter psychrotolerans TaxID=1843235 RepID=A0A4R2H388_9SPHI|nr:alpha/beta hydrolase family protein [Pedobacter psychrotolerans]TCO18673.1 S-formylglutathione hydrolase FrmB [Pedobacter psychrotolerans]GGE69941.1 esterase [Pedobacter psychrotolerans]
MKLLQILKYFIFTSLFPVVSFAASVDTVNTYSKVMNKEIKAVVVKPNTYSASKKYPTLYLLHGAGGNYADWVKQTPDRETVENLSDLFSMVVVCPDGGVTSWYFDSPIDKTYQYETYVSNELVNYIDQHYATIKDRSGRAITGLSMGGHGALYLAFRHQDVFGACGSMSGGVDLRPFPENWNISKRLGPYSENPDRWEGNSVVNLTHLLVPNKLAMMIDCGDGDFFYKVNVALHDKLLDRNIPHDFIIRPGVHNWAYWGNAIHYQMLFFSKYFERNHL